VITNFKLFEGFPKVDSQDWLIWNIKDYIDTKYPAKGGIGIRVHNEKELSVDLGSIIKNFNERDKDYQEKAKETYYDIKNYLLKMGFKLKDDRHSTTMISYVWDLPDKIQKYNL